MLLYGATLYRISMYKTANLGNLYYWKQYSARYNKGRIEILNHVAKRRSVIIFAQSFLANFGNNFALQSKYNSQGVTCSFTATCDVIKPCRQVGAVLLFSKVRYLMVILDAVFISWYTKIPKFNKKKLDHHLPLFRREINHTEKFNSCSQRGIFRKSWDRESKLYSWKQASFHLLCSCIRPHNRCKNLPIFLCFYSLQFTYPNTSYSFTSEEVNIREVFVFMSILHALKKFIILVLKLFTTLERHEIHNTNRVNKLIKAYVKVQTRMAWQGTSTLKTVQFNYVLLRKNKVVAATTWK